MSFEFKKTGVQLKFKISICDHDQIVKKGDASDDEDIIFESNTENGFV